MSLLREIQNDAVSSNMRVADLLRKCKLLARRLGSSELEQWANKELYGFTDSDAVPDYRKFEHLHIKGDFYGPHGSYSKNSLIGLSHVQKVFPNDWEALTAPIVVYMSIAECENAIATHDKNGELTLRSMWPVECAAQMSNEVFLYMQCMKVWLEAPKGKLVQIVDAVKTRILDFAMDIEKENPDAGEADSNETPVAPQTVSHIYHNTIQGGVGNIAQGGQNFQQTATVAPVAQQLNIDWSQLSEELPRLREHMLSNASAEEDFDAVGGIVAAEKALGTKDEPKLIAGLKKGGKVALNVAKDIGTNVTANIITKAMGLG